MSYLHQTKAYLKQNTQTNFTKFHSQLLQNTRTRDSPSENHKRMSSGRVLAYLFLIVLLFFSLNEVTLAHANGLVAAADNSTEAVAMEAEMVPLIEPGKAEMVMMLNESRRKLGSFQICALCTCCGGAKGYCLASPCCYAINCNIPNRPFGFCSFTPKACNCFGCNL